MTLQLRIVDADGATRQESAGEDEVFLVFRHEYRPGDRLTFSAPEPGFFVLALDAALAPALVYSVGGEFALPVPDAAQKKTYPPQAFSGNLHRLQVRRARPDEIALRRDLALNPLDHHGNATLFPHASANVETRGEAVFAARNAIDGECANDDHGFWPYTSWGINRDPEAALTLDFGRPVMIDELALTLRADFPHDAWWERASVSFSDGSTETLALTKTGTAQHFAIAPRTVPSLKLHSLIKADDPSPFPALTRIAVFGREAG
jgi:hypothetical protein